MARHALRTLLFALLLAACAEGTGDAAPDASDGPADAGFVDAGGTAAGDAGRFDAGAVDAGGTDAGAADGGAGDAGLGPARVVVHYDVGFGRRITLRGSAAPLSWTAGYETTWTEGNQWVATLDVAEPVELKPLIDDTKWAEGPNWKVAPGQTVDVWPYFNHTAGAVTKWIDWSNPSLGNTRPVWVYTPPSYSENAAQRYPVVYMHDGQNLFYDSMAFGGTSWNVQGAMDKGIADGTIREALVIGVGNTSARINEYTPVEDSRYAGSGKGDVYLQAVISDLKPKVDAAFRTQAGPANTAIAGSSLGGLISSHAGNKYPHTFGLIGALSPSTWWNGTWIIGQVSATKNAGVKAVRVYVDSGDSGTSNDDRANTANLAQAYTDAGYEVRYVVQQGATHSEVYWRQRIGPALGYLLGPGR